tara:strand:+ start:5920 stop:6777 length:858 start_codon:yes stop_codon:yes gene_type:complete
MLAFNQIGNLGRLGNQMFQYAAVRGIAAMRGYEFCIPPDDVKRVDNYSLYRAFTLESVGQRNQFVLDRGHAPVVMEKHFHFDEELHRMCPNDVSLFGFFQTEKYFANIKDEIARDFTFHDSISAPVKELMDSMDSPPIFLHVRRGDPNLVDARGFKWSYTQCSSQHPPQPLAYYEEALKEFPEDQPVIICSDSPEWVKEQEFFADDRFLVSEPTDKYSDGSWEPFVDLCIMSMCSGAIIANSSLSWWGAWLQRGRGKVVAPKMWFGPDYKDKDTKDLYCEGWITI